MSTAKRQIGRPGKEIRIKLIADDSIEKAKRLINHGGECGSLDILMAIIELLGAPKAWNRQISADKQMMPEQARLCFYREGKAPIECDYVSVYCAVTQEIEIRPSASDAEGTGGD